MSDNPKLREILDHVAELPLEERSAYLTQACGNDTVLRNEVESLLFALDSSKDFLSGVAANGGARPL